MDQFKEELRRASFRYKMLEGTGRVATSMAGAISGKQTRYPATYQRTGRLQKLDESFTERTRDQSGTEKSGP